VLLRIERSEIRSSTAGRKLRGGLVAQAAVRTLQVVLLSAMVGTIDGDGYRIEKIIYESQARHCVTAILFLPKSKPPFPAVLAPCGHSRSGKATQQRMCILLAKYGIAALSYDPIGQGERSQLLDADGKQRFKATSEHDLVGKGSTPYRCDGMQWRQISDTDSRCRGS